MGIEKEQKFNLKYFPDFIVKEYAHIQQAYLLFDDNSELRVRIISHGNISSACITYKSKIDNVSRLEYEYAIPVSDALEMYNSSKFTIEKTRYSLNYKGNRVEIDRYRNGLDIVEIEYSGELLSPEEIPDFCGEPLDNKIFSNLKLTLNRNK